MIDDDIYNSIIDFKAKNEMIKMNKNYSCVEKRIWQTNTFMNIMLMTKIMLDMCMWGPFQNRYGVIVS